MMSVKMRIGTKLALSAGIGVLLTAGIVTSSLVANNSVARLSAASSNQWHIQKGVAIGLFEVRSAQYFSGVIRDAKSNDEIDNPLKDLHARAAAAKAEFDAAARLAVDAESRDSLTKAGALASEYAGTLDTFAAVQKRVLAARARRDASVDDWNKELGALSGSPSLDSTARPGLEPLLQRADSLLKDASIAATRGDKGANAQFTARGAELVGKATELLKQAREAAGDKAI
jgi:hypothetical protein